MFFSLFCLCRQCIGGCGCCISCIKRVGDIFFMDLLSSEHLSSRPHRRRRERTLTLVELSALFFSARTRYSFSQRNHPPSHPPPRRPLLRAPHVTFSAASVTQCFAPVSRRVLPSSPCFFSSLFSSFLSSPLETLHHGLPLAHSSRRKIDLHPRSRVQPPPLSVSSVGALQRISRTLQHHGVWTTCAGCNSYEGTYVRVIMHVLVRR
jgi:hypothetical protein